GDHSQQSAHGYHVADLGQLSAEHPAAGGCHHARDFLGFDFEEFLARLHQRPDFLEPAIDPGRFHRQPPLGQGDLVNRCHQWYSRTRLTAASILAGLGMYRSSSTSLNGTGVCGAVTCSIGAFRARNAFWATSPAMSEAMLQRGLDSSTTTKRPVFSTLSRMVSSSSGDVVRGSMISQ